jgi:hypothetical protein
MDAGPLAPTGDQIGAGIADRTVARAQAAGGRGLLVAVAAIGQPGGQVEALVAAEEKEANEEAAEGRDQGPEALLEGEEGAGG